MKSLLLIDADQIFYQCTSATEFESTVGNRDFQDAWMFEGYTALLSDPEEAQEAIEQKLASITAGYDKSILCFTSTPNFRHEVLSTYKGGRLKKRKPLCYWDLIEEFTKDDDWETRKFPGLEADDVMSIIATHPKYLKKYKMSIYSQDKDMRQVPDVPIIRPDGTKKTFSLASANHWRYTQALTGDTTDGYFGLKGVGPVAAQKILDGLEGSPEDVYVDTVISAYQEWTSSPYAVVNAHAQIDCACILRYSEYNTQTHQPILSKERHNA